MDSTLQPLAVPHLGVAYHALVTLDKDSSKLLILCGTHSPSFDSAFTSTVWEHDTKKGAWRMIPEAGSGPSPRALPSAARIGTTVYLFGGYHIENLKYRSFNDLYALDTGAMTWSNLQPQGIAPSPRAGASLVAYRGEIILFGGGQGTSLLFNDLHSFNPIQNRWTSMQTSSILRPEPRCGHTSVVVSDKMYVFGGWSIGSDSEKGPSNEMWSYDFDMKEWTLIKTKGKAPSPRTGHTTVAVGPYILVVGGASNMTKLMNSIFKFDTRTKHWGKIKYSGALPGITGATSVICSDSRELMIFGGKLSDGSLSASIWTLDMVQLPLTPPPREARTLAARSKAKQLKSSPSSKIGKKVRQGHKINSADLTAIASTLFTSPQHSDQKENTPPPSITGNVRQKVEQFNRQSFLIKPLTPEVINASKNMSGKSPVRWKMASQKSRTMRDRPTTVKSPIWTQFRTAQV